MENNQLKHGENCCPSHWNLMRIFLSASSREEHSHNILFILQRFLFDLWWVTRQGLTVLLKDTLTGKPSVNRTVWSVGIYCQRRMCAWVMRVIHLWYEHTNIQTDIHTHTQWWISNKTGISCPHTRTRTNRCDFFVTLREIYSDNQPSADSINNA